MSGERGEAALGAVIGDISDLSDPENIYERQRWSHLIELYLPVRQRVVEVIAVAEFYQLPDDLEAEVDRDRLIASGLVAAATVLAYLALVRVVRQGSETILRQQDELRRQVDELSTLLDQNARLSDRIRHAAARTTALTELERRRISSDLHDGPSQTPRLRDAPAGCRRGPTRGRRPRRRRRPAGGARRDGRAPDRHADHRGRLRTPELVRATPAGSSERAVAGARAPGGRARRSWTSRGIPERGAAGDQDRPLPDPVRGAVERRRHGGGAGDPGQGRRMATMATWSSRCSDAGPGFDAAPQARRGPPRPGRHARTDRAAGRPLRAGVRRRSRHAGPRLPAADRTGERRRA